MQTTEIARHMISKDWGIAIDKVTMRSGKPGYRCSTVGLIIGVGLSSNPWAWFNTEEEARKEANNEWKIQTDRPAQRRNKGNHCK